MTWPAREVVDLGEVDRNHCLAVISLGSGQPEPLGKRPRNSLEGSYESLKDFHEALLMATQLGHLKTGRQPVPLLRRNNSLIRGPNVPALGENMGRHHHD